MIYQLTRLADISSMKTGKLNSNAAIENGMYPFFTCAQETYRINTAAFNTEAVLLGGNNANGIYPLKYYSGEFNAYQRTYVFETLDQNVLSVRYLYYALKPALRHFQASSIGAVTQYLTKPVLDNFKIPLPNIDLQKDIVEILAAYDDLIENNCRRIQLLEESARLLYQEWFIQQRFPGHKQVKFTDSLPEGWSQKPLSELCVDVRDAVQPGSVKPETPYIGLEHIPRRSITLSTWESSEKVTSTKLLFRKSDILFGKIRPYFHKIGFTICDGITSSDSIVIRPTNQIYYDYLLMYLSSDFFIALASKTCKEGSKMPRANWDYLLTTHLLVPNDALIQQFSIHMQFIRSQLEILAKYNKSLAQARDTLLPKLMSGELTV